MLPAEEPRSFTFTIKSTYRWGTHNYMSEKHDTSPSHETWVGVRDKLVATGMNDSDAVYLEAALTGGEAGLNYSTAVLRLREILEEAGWHPEPAQKKRLEETE